MDNQMSQDRKSDDIRRPYRVKTSGRVAVRLRPRERHDSVLGDVVAGALAGAVASVAMMMVRPMATRVALGPRRRGQRRPRAPEPEWEHLVRTKARDAGYDLPENAVRVAGSMLHVGYGAAWGAVYGVTAGRRQAGAPGTALYSVLVYLANYSRGGVMPALGLLPADDKRPARQAAIPMATHAMFGSVTAAGYGVLRPLFR
jgi:hypothetical protein